MPIVRLSVIIVTYNCEEFIENCLKSVLKFLPKDGEVIVVDNASTDGTMERVKGEGERVKIIENDENLGFSKANNIGTKEAKGEYLFFLNPDTEIKTDIFDELLSFYEQTQDAGIVAPKLLLPSGETQASVRNIPTVGNAINEYIFGKKYAYSEYTPQTNDPVEVDMVYGAAMLIKKSLFEKVGGFNEKYFLYYEDIDLCNRIRKLGKKIYYDPKVSITHLVGATKTKVNKNDFNIDSAKKYHGILGFYILELIFLINRVVNKFGS